MSVQAAPRLGPGFRGGGGRGGGGGGRFGGGFGWGGAAGLGLGFAAGAALAPRPYLYGYGYPYGYPYGYAPHTVLPAPVYGARASGERPAGPEAELDARRASWAAVLEAASLVKRGDADEMEAFCRAALDAASTWSLADRAWVEGRLRELLASEPEPLQPPAAACRAWALAAASAMGL